MVYRLRLRTLLILIAVSAAVMAGIVVGTRKTTELRAEYRARALRHAEFARYCWGASRACEMLAREYRQWPDDGFRRSHRVDETSKAYADRKALYLAEADFSDKDRITYAVRAAFHGRMKDKYVRAAERPWWPISADPPTPDFPNRTSLLPEVRIEVHLSR